MITTILRVAVTLYFLLALFGTYLLFVKGTYSLYDVGIKVSSTLLVLWLI